MQFHTHLFILAVLPVVVAGYHLLNRIHVAAGHLFLIAASIVFYGYAGRTELICLGISAVVNYLAVVLVGNRTGNRKAVLSAAVIFNIGLLFYFKYLNFSLSVAGGLLGRAFTPREIYLPLGISFFTFQQIAYVVDTYRGKTDRYSFRDYLLYILYFPKILMGPIVRPADLIPQFHDRRRKKIDPRNLMEGIRIFNIGLFKKVLVADTFAKAVGWGFSNLKTATSADLLLVMFAYTFQIYFDFSGYSDMAVGVSRMLNIDLPINFDSPYKAYSIRDFWKRWHISLTRFLTEYLYIPLGGNRKGKCRTYLHIMVVFLVSGLWHGANWTFLLWGALHGALSIFDRATDRLREKIHPAMQWMASFVAVSMLWLLFRAESIPQWLQMLETIFSFRNTAVSDGLLKTFVLPETNLLLHVLHASALNSAVRGLPMLAMFVFAIVLCLCFENAFRKKGSGSLLSAVFSACIFVFALTCIGGESVFVYFDF